jgi:hypothetical protein
LIQGKKRESKATALAIRRKLTNYTVIRLLQPSKQLHTQYRDFTAVPAALIQPPSLCKSNTRETYCYESLPDTEYSFRRISTASEK